MGSKFTQSPKTQITIVLILFLLVTTPKDRGGSIKCPQKKTLKSSHSENVQKKTDQRDTLVKTGRATQ